MIFLSLWVTADAGGGLKIRAHQHPDLQGLGGGSHQQASDGIYRGIACYNGDTPPKKGGRSPYAAAHTQATMGGNRTDEALLELSTLVLANCQPALPLRRSICAG